MTRDPSIVALAGGVGASKLLRGMVRTVPPASLTVIVNTGDDISVHGLHVSPDLDTVTYSLAEAADPERGWGLEDETWNALKAMQRYEMATWFQLGDRDLATHLYRTKRLSEGAGLGRVTREICEAWGVQSEVLPMTESLVTNRVVVGQFGSEEDLHFQQYLIERALPPRFCAHTSTAPTPPTPAPGVLDAIRRADHIVVCPSNPVVSIAPILAVPGIEEAVRANSCPKTAVSPIIGSSPVRGPADKLMPPAGIDVSCVGIARHYAGLADTVVIDVRDEARTEEVSAYAKCLVADTLMTDVSVSSRLAALIVDEAKSHPGDT